MDINNIKAIFLDIGGVILTNGWDHESRQKAAEVFGLDYEEMNRQHTFVYNIFELGHMTMDDYLDTVIFNEPRSFSRTAFKDFMYAQSSALPALLPWLKEWKQQVKLPVFALSNENAELNEYRISTFGLHQVFDGFFSSCYLGVRKPDPLIYKRAIEICHVKPQECLYFDDRLMLVNAALKFGIQAIQHKNFETTRDILHKFIQ